ncbi:MAG: Calx-beta domain-containing protein, partial [Acidimicrobiales bacterium]
AYGLRNPFRMAFRPGTSDLFVGDVGWDTWEEVDKLTVPVPTAPVNFGWPCYEGPARQPGFDAADLNLCENLYAQGAGAVRAATFSYDHTNAVVAGDGCGVASGSAISGVAFGPTSGTNYPAAYRGALYISDYTRRCIWMVPAAADGNPDFSRRQQFVTEAGDPVELQIGTGGDLFYVELGAGAIHRITYAGGNQPPVAVALASPSSGAAPLTVSFDGSHSSDPEGGPLTYAWDLDNDGAFDDSTLINPNRVFSVPGTFTVRLQVTDNQGSTAIGTVVVTPGNTAPQAVIDAPVLPPSWSVGDPIAFSGHATDTQQGTLPSSALTWSVLMHHCFDLSSCHTHFVQTFTGVAGGSFNAPDYEYPSYLELKLTATDAGGLTSTASMRLDPQTLDLTFASNPPGIALTVGTASGPTPLTRTVIRGSSVSVSAPPSQVVAGKEYQFAGWSDGGARVHDLVAGVGAAAGVTTYTATYVDATPAVIPGNTTVVEGNSGVRTALVPVTLSHPSIQTVTAAWATLGQGGLPGSVATPSDDYTPASGTVTFAPGETAKTVSVPIIGDTTNEPDEYAVLSWSNPTKATIGGYYGLGFLTIQNDDPVPTIVPGGVTVVEGNSGTRTMSLPVTLSNPSSRPVTASWSTVRPPGLPGSPADTPADYQASSGTVTFAPGETVRSVSITVDADTIDEPDEYLLVAFANPTNASIGGYLGLGFGTIQDDDPQPVMQPGSTSVVEGDGGTRTLAIPVTLSAPSGRSVTASWSTTIPPSASVPLADSSDYVAASGTVTFAPGETAKVVSVTVNGDVTVEPDELVVVWFSGATNATVGGFYGLGFGVITNDDTASGSPVPPTRTWNRYD